MMFTMDELWTFVQDRPYITGLLVAPVVILAARKLFGRGAPLPPYCPPDTVLLYQVPRGPYAPSLSPFPLKLETYLRMAGIPYVNDLSGKFSKKGKTPWISYNGEDVADSQLCIEYLNKKRGVDLNKNLKKEGRAVARAIQVLVDEHLYWIVIYYRWIDRVSPLVKQFLPALVRPIIKRTLRGQLQGQGIGRHSPEEVRQIMVQDLQALADYLGDKQFMMGNEPTEVDCAVFGMLSQFVWQDIETKTIEDDFPSLCQYCVRMKEKFWPDWDDCITHGFTRKATK